MAPTELTQVVVFQDADNQGFGLLRNFDNRNLESRFLSLGDEGLERRRAGEVDPAETFEVDVEAGGFVILGCRSRVSSMAGVEPKYMTPVDGLSVGRPRRCC